MGMEPSRGKNTQGWGSEALADTHAAITDGQEGWHIQPHLRPLIKAATFLCPSHAPRV